MGRWLREPLVQCALIGALIYLVPAGGTDPATSTPLHIDHRQAAGLLRRAAAGRGLSALGDDERQQLLMQAVERDLLVREARRLGLDRGDPIIRRRLIQKMEFLIADQARASGGIDEDELRRRYRRSLEAWRRPASCSFRHVFFSSGRRGAAARSDADTALAQLGADSTEPPPGMGDPSPIPRRLRRATWHRLRRDLGAETAKALFRLPLHKWSGPLESPYGWHLVYVDERTPERVLPFEEVRHRLLKQARAEQVAAWRRRFMARLAQQFDLTVEGRPVRWWSTAEERGEP